MPLPRLDSPPQPDQDTSSSGRHLGCVLVLDDDPSVLKSYSRILERAGFTVVGRSNGVDVGRVLGDGSFDAVLTDVSMPGVDGTEVLRVVRERDPDLPVIMMTALGDVRSAALAVELRALRYLFKPVDMDVLVATVTDAVRLRGTAAAERQARDLVDRAATEVRELGARFERALGSVHLFHQPIVSWPGRAVFAHEALLRADEPGLAAPGPLLAAAEMLGRLPDLSRVIRRRAAERLRGAPPDTCAFVNLHPFDLSDDELYSPSAPLSEVASHVVLEVTECASLEGTTDLSQRLDALRKMGFRIALDDLGAGYASLSAFAHLAPHAVKLDMSLTRGIETDSTKRKLIASMTHLCHELGIIVVGEGVETATQRDALVSLGCDLLQGYLFARPAADYPHVAW
jgi:EAL domain-containing protein (putative c-di-GMP-specific phosphodiesterase class I)